MKISHAARTEVGLVRRANEDRYLARPDLGLFAVCDGVGGHRGGDVAAKTACRELETFFGDAWDRTAGNDAVQNRSDRLGQFLEAAILTAHRKIVELSEAELDYAGMGTTCTAALVSADTVILGHVGDTRLYRLSDGRIEQISEDHSFVNELVKSGTITPEEALTHPQANIITQALGSTPTLRVDIQIIDTRPGDTFLLCSDGLTCYVPHEADLAPALGRDDLQQGVDELVNRALAAGGRDNVTCVMFRV